jgi:tetratricopeptide (TPR) repeat protein
VRQGCYDCLTEARAAYRALGAGPLGPIVLRRLFETELLVAARERELALRPSDAMAAASELARELPASVDADRYVAAIESLPHDRHGWPRRERTAFLQSNGLSSARAAEEAAWIRQGSLSEHVAEYLAVAVECAFVPRSARQPAGASPSSAETAPETAPEAAPPLVRYRRAICDTPDRQALEAVRADVPRFAEASFFLAQLAVSSIAAGGGGDPHALVEAALAWMPESPAATYLSSSLQFAISDWARAIAFYDQTLALKPGHEDAWLGRTISLTELHRTDEAIDAATRMIGLGLDNADQALYWRAWNRHARGELDPARADIEDAKRRRRSEEMLTLAGIIAHDQGDFESARRDLQQALGMAKGRNCRALWYMGSVHVKERNWPDGAATFESAMTCYADDVASRENAVRGLEANTALDAAFRRSRLARLGEEIRIQRRQHLAAAFNAASFHALSGDLVKARRFAEVAAQDPDLGDELDELHRHMAAVAATRRE